MIALTKLILVGLLAVAADAKPSIDQRIVGGFEARDKLFPYAAALFINKGESDENFCGGSIISENYILTAAHCAVIAREITVVMGTVELDTEVETQVIMNASDIIIPDDYNASLYDWDLALLKLPEPLELTEYIQPIKLAEGDYSYAGELSVVLGWGFQWGGQTTYEEHLRFVENIILSNNQCTKDDPTYKEIVKDSQICQSTLAGRGSCHGDSGGPLVVDGDTQVGIVSLGSINCFLEKPVVFTRITSYRQWIKEKSGI
ncbi:hypothetical protein NQ318_021256 [Aromia moschata]|uniref:Peptidase S1 domain-containing protein n=1 Tax=Aromia moschata TaxID=1265417 RepID=A0AAV8ZBK6_9CUCU|nr:hypothetical protein NQ318_021256 [Aromia moschata]